MNSENKFANIILKPIGRMFYLLLGTSAGYIFITRFTDWIEYPFRLDKGLFSRNLDKFLYLDIGFFICIFLLLTFGIIWEITKIKLSENS